MRKIDLTIKTDDVLSLQSADRIFISLPYRTSGDLLYEAYIAVCEAMDSPAPDETDDAFAAAVDAAFEGSNIAAYLTLNPQRRAVHALFRLKITMPDGRQIERKYIPISQQPETTVAILQGFFAAGSPGIRADLREHWKQFFLAYQTGAGEAA